MARHEAYEQARQRAESKLGFYRHLATYPAVCALLTIINLSTAPDALWVLWPILGWGIAVLLHGLGVFVLNGRSPLTTRMIGKELGAEP